MAARHGAVLLLCAAVVGVLGGTSRASSSSADVGSYLNEWAAHIPGGHGVAQRVARELGYVNRGQVSNRTAFSSPNSTRRARQDFIAGPVWSGRF